MTQSISSSCCLNTLSLPVRAVWSAMVWVAQKIYQLFQHSIGHYTRIGVFMLGEYRGFGAQIMELIKASPSDPRSRGRLDFQRLWNSKKKLVDMGGIPKHFWTSDGIKLDGMLFFNKKPDKKNILLIFGTGASASYMMERKWIEKHYALGYDLCVYDPRGTVRSKGVASEGGYYRDAESVYQEMLTYGYEGQIILVGSCLGASRLAFVQKNHPEVPLVSIKTAPDIATAVGNKNSLGVHGIPALQMGDPEIEDGFDMLKKMKGTNVIISIAGDTVTGGEETHKLLMNSAKKAHGIVYEHGTDEEGHVLDPLDASEIWDWYVKKLDEVI